MYETKTAWQNCGHCLVLVESIQLIRVRNSSPERRDTGSPERAGPAPLGGANYNGPNKVPAVFDGSRETPSRNAGQLSCPMQEKGKLFVFLERINTRGKHTQSLVKVRKGFRLLNPGRCRPEDKNPEKRVIGSDRKLPKTSLRQRTMFDAS
jgi:hypothetical protein